MKRNSHTTLWMLFLVMLALLPINMLAEGLKIDSFEATSDISATQQPRKDENMKICALVKILVIDKVTDVRGNTVADGNGQLLVKKGMETWVWLKPGSQQMTVFTATHGATVVNFALFGISELSSSTTYYLTLLDEGSEKGNAGMLKVNYMPIDCEVFIDGNKAGMTPGLFRNLPTGKHELEVRKNGYNTAKERILISSAQTVSVSGKLVKESLGKKAVSLSESTGKVVSNVMISGILSVNYEPQDSEVLIDGMLLGYSPDNFFLYNGDYELEIRHEGYESEKRNISITRGGRFSVSGQLKANNK